jgi:hypothetical protein
MKPLTLLPALSLALALVACPSSPPTPAVLAGVAGTWNDQSVSNGVPRSQYRFSVSGTAMSGETYFRDAGVLKRVGALKGTLSADGSAEWTTPLTDNGADGSESVVGKFSGASFTGTFTIRNADNSVRQQETQGLDRAASGAAHGVAPTGARRDADKVQR